MEENIYYSALFDIYGSLLTDKQKDYFMDYFFENLTIEEIAENHNISKNAVSKQLKAVKNSLKYYEKSLKLYERRNLLKKEFEKEPDILLRIEKYDSI